MEVDQQEILIGNSNKKTNGLLESNTDTNSMRKHDKVVLEERTQNIPIEVKVNVVNENKSA